MRKLSEVHRQSIEQPERFWGEAAARIRWRKPFRRVLDAERAPFYRWFSEGELNTCENALDRHVEAGYGSRGALIYDSPVTGRQQRFSYAELLDRVARFAGGLAGLGVGRGDRVLIYMPMVPEAVVAMLACARLGAIHSVVFGGFAAKELAHRVDDAAPKVILSASCGVEPGRIVEYGPLLDRALELASVVPDWKVILERPECPIELRPGELGWQQVERAEPIGCVPVQATDPLYVLYTSGTTGVPKGVVRDNGGHAVALQWSLENVYGMRPGDVFWAASDIGWVVGHSYIVYAPLLLGCTTILYEGKPVGTPDPGAFWRVISEHRANALFTAPTAFRAIKKEDPEGRHISAYDLSSLRTLFLAGERADPATVEWAGRHLGVPVVDHWWQTESGWPMASNCMGIEVLPIKPGSPCKPVPGYDVRVVERAGDDHDHDHEPAGGQSAQGQSAPAEGACGAAEIRELPAGETGAIVVRLPLPPGCLTTLWNQDDRFVESYLSRYPGFYETADAGYFDADGYLFVMARTDDIINVAGHRLSTGGMEEVLAEHPDVAECAVIGVADRLKGQLPLGLVVLNAGVDRDAATIVAELVQRMRERLGPVAAFKQAAIVKRLPKTRSGKVLRGTLRRIADSEPWKLPATIEDPSVLDEITPVLHDLGYAEQKSGPIDPDL